jgi:hypothetical protein
MSRVISVDGVDVAGVLNLAAVRPTSAAFRGEQGAGQMEVDDPDFDDFFASLKIVRITDDASGSTKHLFRGRVISKNYGRGPYAADDSRVIALNVQDSNWDLRRLRVHQWSRPAETGRARVIALLAYILNGSSSTVTNATKRPSTVIASTYVPNTNTVTMEARVYDATDPVAVLDDCARAEGKDYFVFVDDAGNMHLFFDRPTSTALACTLSITDDDPDLVTEFAPIVEGMAGDEDGTELLSGGALIPSSGNAGIVTESRAGIIAAHDVAEETVYDSGAGSDAATRLDAFLDERENEELRYRVSIEVPASQAHLIRAGQTISLRSAACGVLSPLVVRIARLELEILVPGDEYRLNMELAFPDKLTPRIQSIGQGSILQKNPDATFVDGGYSVTADNVFTSTALIEGGDTVWTGTPSNLPGYAGVEYDVYDYAADAICGPDVQLREPYQRFAGTLCTFTGVTGEPVLLRASIEWAREDPPLGPRPTAKQWMPILITVQWLDAGEPIPISTLYAGNAVRIINDASDGDAFEVTVPIWGSGTTRRYFFVFLPLWSLSAGAHCAFPDDWGASSILADDSGSLVIELLEIASAGWVEVAPLGVPNGVDVTYDLVGNVSEVAWVQKNGLLLPASSWSVDTSTDQITFDAPPLPTDLVVVRYRVG